MAAAGAAQESGMTPEIHPWGRFKPGAWKLYQATTETFDEHGKALSKSTTYTNTTLKPGGDRRGLTLLVEAVVEMAGRRIEPPPSEVTEGYLGESPGEVLVVNLLPAESVPINGKRIACKVERIEASGPAGRTTSKVWYSKDVAPHVLRRESRTVDREGNATETTLTVESLGIPCDVLPNIAAAARVVITTAHAKGKTVTRALTSAEIPGGVVCHTADEFDAGGRLRSRSTLTLIDYGLTPKKERSGLFNRIRSRGHRSHRPQPDP
jgi:hypothetical protein